MKIIQIMEVINPQRYSNAVGKFMTMRLSYILKPKELATNKLKINGRMYIPFLVLPQIPLGDCPGLVYL